MRMLSLVFLMALLVVTACSGGTTSRPAPPAEYLTIDLIGAKQEFPVDGQGRLKAGVSLSSPDGDIGVSAPANTAVTGRDSRPLQAFQAVIDSSPPPPAADTFRTGTVYRLLPEGATFKPPLTLTLGYKAGRLPSGIAQENLYIAYFDGKGWQPSFSRKIDFTASTIATQVDRGGTFTVMGGRGSPPAGPAAPVVGSMKGNLAPDFTLQGLDGQTYSLSSLRGRPVMINFWTTWCVYCVIEMPLLEEAHRKFEPKGLALLAVDVNEPVATVRSFVQEKRLTLPVLLDSRGSVAEKYRVAAFPTTYLIDASGVIRDIRVGAFPNRSAIESTLRKIMP